MDRLMTNLRPALAMVKGNLQVIYDSLDQEREAIRRLSEPLDLAPSGAANLDMVEFYRDFYRPFLDSQEVQPVEGSEQERVLLSQFIPLAGCWRVSRIVDSKRRIEELEQKKEAYISDILLLKKCLRVVGLAESESDNSDSESDDSDSESDSDSEFEDSDSDSDEGDYKIGRVQLDSDSEDGNSDSDSDYSHSNFGGKIIVTVRQQNPFL